MAKNKPVGKPAITKEEATRLANAKADAKYSDSVKRELGKAKASAKARAKDYVKTAKKNPVPVSPPTTFTPPPQAPTLADKDVAKVISKNKASAGLAKVDNVPLPPRAVGTPPMTRGAKVMSLAKNILTAKNAKRAVVVGAIGAVANIVYGGKDTAKTPEKAIKPNNPPAPKNIPAPSNAPVKKEAPPKKQSAPKYESDTFGVKELEARFKKMKNTA